MVPARVSDSTLMSTLHALQIHVLLLLLLFLNVFYTPGSKDIIIIIITIANKVEVMWSFSLSVIQWAGLY